MKGISFVFQNRTSPAKQCSLFSIFMKWKNVHSIYRSNCLWRLSETYWYLWLKYVEDFLYFWYWNFFLIIRIKINESFVFCLCFCVLYKKHNHKIGLKDINLNKKSIDDFTAMETNETCYLSFCHLTSIEVLKVECLTSAKVGKATFGWSLLSSTKKLFPIFRSCAYSRRGFISNFLCHSHSAFCNVYRVAWTELEGKNCQYCYDLTPVFLVIQSLVWGLIRSVSNALF